MTSTTLVCESRQRALPPFHAFIYGVITDRMVPARGGSSHLVTTFSWIAAEVCAVLEWMDMVELLDIVDDLDANGLLTVIWPTKLAGQFSQEVVR